MRSLSVVLIGLCLNFSCKKDEKPQPLNPLTLISDYALQVPEPSGLCEFIEGNLLSVSDVDGKIYNIDIEGQTIAIIDIQGTSLEGITFDSTDSTIYVVDEWTGVLSALSISGELLNTWQIDDGGDNSGLEGCGIDSGNRVIYMLKEKSPGRLYTFDMDTEVHSSVQLDFADDYSGVFYDGQDQLLWIVSDKSMSVNRCDLNGNLIMSHAIDVDQAEGIVVDFELDRIYVVGDSQERLFVFEKP